MSKTLSNFDKMLIKSQYGSVREYNKIKKSEHDAAVESVNRDIRIKENQILSTYMDNIKEEEKRNKIQLIKKGILNKYIGATTKKEYDLYILVYDICCNSFYNIESGLQRGKYTIEEYKNIINEFIVAGVIEADPISL